MSSAEARGKLRAWKRETAARYAACQKILNDGAPHALIRQMVLRAPGKGRERVFRRLRALIPHARLEGVSLTGKYPLAIWARLNPREAVAVNTDDPSRQQDCVVVEYLLLGAIPEWVGGESPGRITPVVTDVICAQALWDLEVTDHALVRLLQRAPGANLDAVLWAAHRSSMLAREDDAMLQLGSAGPRRSFLLPAGPGVFVCEAEAGPAAATGELLCFLRAPTWLHNDQLHDNQIPLLVEAGTGRRLGEGPLLPKQLRRLILRERHLYIERWEPGLQALAYLRA